MTDIRTTSGRPRVLAFDFDGTLTTADTLLRFIRYACGTRAFIAGFLLHAPLLVLMKLRLMSGGRVKERIFTHFFRGMAIERFDDLCRSFARDSRHLLRPQGMAAIDSALADGHRVLIVSASIANWVRPFFPQTAVTIVCTGIETRDGLVTGRFATPNCHGAEKVRRLLEVCPDRQSYHLTAFGDSRGDREMLALADEAHYRPFR